MQMEKKGNIVENNVTKNFFERRLLSARPIS